MTITLLKAAAAAAILAAPMSADALQVEFASGGTTVTIDDKTLTDNLTSADNDANEGIISSSFFSVGTAFVVFDLIASTDMNGTSTLNLILSAITGADSLSVKASDTGYGQGAYNGPSNLTFSMNASVLDGNPVNGIGYVDNSDALFGMADAIGFGGTLLSVTSSINDVDTAGLSDPFSMSIFTTISANTDATFDATAMSSVPVPAAGLMLLAGLGGLGAMRRRKG